ncbi:ParB/RepB/Spo0J family partition protein [Patescibacteria group bacterium]
MSQEYGLGRGLASLIPQKHGQGTRGNSGASDDFRRPAAGRGKEDEKKKEDAVDVSNGSMEVEIGKIKTNPFQPRTNFDKEKLRELSDSIKHQGIIQPLIVTRSGDDFELIAGERRLQASKEVGLQKVPVVVRDVNNKEKLEWAIAENVQRHNLNPIEEAKAYKRLMDEFDLTQEEVAKKMGKSRSLVANKIRLLDLPIDVQKALISGYITEGHAKAILAISDQQKRITLLDMIIKGGLTVRQAEKKTQEMDDSKQRKHISIDPKIRDLESRLAEKLGTKVKLKKSGEEGGKIIIDFYSKEELDGILGRISIEEQ